jgi:putative Mn2+ efflux pump MntP
MYLENGRQRLFCLAIIAGLVAVVAVVIGWIVTSLSDANIKGLAKWLDENLDDIGTWLLAAVPAVATYLFGRRGGRKAGKTEAYNSAIATVIGSEAGAGVAKTLKQEALAHNLTVTVGRDD